MGARNYQQGVMEQEISHTECFMKTLSHLVRSHYQGALQNSVRAGNYCVGGFQHTEMVCMEINGKFVYGEHFRDGAGCGQLPGIILASSGGEIGGSLIFSMVGYLRPSIEHIALHHLALGQG